MKTFSLKLLSTTVINPLLDLDSFIHLIIISIFKENSVWYCSIVLRNSCLLFLINYQSENLVHNIISYLTKRFIPTRGLHQLCYTVLRKVYNIRYLQVLTDQSYWLQEQIKRKVSQQISGTRWDSFVGRVSASHAVGCGFASRSGHINDH